MANETVEEPTAATAGEEDHEDPDSLRGEEADAPRDPDAEIDDLQFEEVEHGADQPGAGS
jgi:hypothetical protein